MLQGRHVGSVTYCYGDWRIGRDSFEIELSQLEPLLTRDRLKTIPLYEIAWKGKHLPDHMTGEDCLCCGGERFKNANTRYPGIVVEGLWNMYGNKYRLIDGKHRIRKLYESSRFVDEASFYVLTLDDIEEFITWRCRSQ
tara:strand:+ start:2958 stop:3374 length:417 start_codon:yes stop_codon:yes gene_type:complete